MRLMHPPAVIATTCLLFLTACSDPHGGGPGGDLGEATDLPAGDARGSDASGDWAFEVYTSVCEGACGPFEVSGWDYTACDVGERLDGTSEVEQEDGALTIDADDSFYVTRLEGGIDADGSFDIGGFATQNGGHVEITARVTGAFESDEFDAVSDFHFGGTLEGQKVDCRAAYEIEGIRLAKSD